MTENTAILLLDSHLSALGLSAGAFRDKAADWAGQSRVRIVESWSRDHVGDLSGLTGIVLAGRSEPLPWIDLEGPAQFPVDLLSWVPWMEGEAEENAAALLAGALEAAGAAKPAGREIVETVPLVAIIGAGRAADRTAKAAMEQGLDVLRAVPEDGPASEAGDFLRYKRLCGAAGFAGRFTLLFETADGYEERPAGAIVLVGTEERSPEDAPGVLNLTPISVFEREIAQDPPAGWVEDTDFKVVFLAGQTRHSSTGQMRRILEAALFTAEKTKAQPYLLAPQVKVASSGLERLYSQAREAGLIHIRAVLANECAGCCEEGAPQIRVFDPLAGADLWLRPGLVVAEEPLIPSGELAGWARDLHLDLGPDGYLSPDNVLFLPAATNRRGVFAVGPARGSDGKEAEELEIRTAVAGASEVLAIREVDAGHLIVDKGRCTICLTCVRTCPHYALGFTHRPWSDPIACQRCGLCAAECPMDALQLAGHADRQVKARVDKLLARARKKDGPPRVVLFGCRRSAGRALAGAEKQSTADVCFLPLPCAGKIEDDLVLDAFIGGADGVLIAACHDGNCRTHKGSPEARRRYEHFRKLLGEAGLDPGRLEFTTTAPNLGAEFGRFVDGFAVRIEKMGPSPLTGAE